MYVDTRDKGLAPDLMSKGHYDRMGTELAKNLLKPGMVVADLGANIGYFTLLFGGLVGSQGRVYAFEPEPKNYELLVKNIEANGCKQCVPVQKAVSNISGRAEIITDKINFGGPSISEANVPNSERDGSVEVETITLDEFFGSTINNDHIDFIKIDVQGAEGLVIDGANKVLKGRDLKMVMEFWPHGLRNVGTDPLNLLQKLRGYGFRMELIEEENRRLNLRQMEATEIFQMCESVKGKSTVDLLLVK